LKEILEQVLEMPYYKNYAATSGNVHNISKHEDAVEDIFKLHNLEKVEAKVPKSRRDLWMSDQTKCDLQPGSYIPQPCGKNDSPDFIVKDKQGRVFFIECKSVSKKTKAPMFNSGVPKPSYIYIFSAERYNQTTIFLGKDVVPPKDYEIFQQLIREHRELDKKWNQKFTNPYGIQHYTRPMIQHVGGTDYFNNPHREGFEQRVFKYVS
jgi:hypothetical protein